MIDIIIVSSVFGIFIILAFVLGARIGQKIVKQEEITIVPNPIKAIHESIEKHTEKKETKKEIEKLDIITENIDNYDGTGLGQKDIPR